MRRIRLIFDFLLDLLYPPRCPGCGEVISVTSKDAFCTLCRDNWEELKDGRCPKCDQPIRECWCGISGDKEGYINAEHHLVVYDKGISSVTNQLVYSIKNYDNKRVFEMLGKEFADELYCRLDFNDIVVTAVPRSPKTKRKIGHDQSVNIAKAFCLYADLEYVDVLYHVGNIKQKKLSREERSKNAVKSYKIKNGSSQYLKNMNVILIDDVVTTGSTVIRCAHLLKMRGAKSVTVFSIAKTKRAH